MQCLIGIDLRTRKDVSTLMIKPFLKEGKVSG